jgi:hypothetical protein
MLDTVDLTFVSRRLKYGVGTSAGFGTVGGGRVVSEAKKMKHVDISTEIKELIKNIAEQTEKNSNIITMLFLSCSLHSLHNTLLLMNPLHLHQVKAKQ